MVALPYHGTTMMISRSSSRAKKVKSGIPLMKDQEKSGKEKGKGSGKKKSYLGDKLGGQFISSSHALLSSSGMKSAPMSMKWRFDNCLRIKGEAAVTIAAFDRDNGTKTE